jgi:hypothetical protein
MPLWRASRISCGVLEVLPDVWTWQFIAAPINPSRINNFEFWQSEEALNNCRAASNPLKQTMVQAGAHAAEPSAFSHGRGLTLASDGTASNGRFRPLRP